MYDTNDVMIVHNILLSDDVIIKKFSKPAVLFENTNNLSSKIIEIIPNTDIYYDDRWHIIKLSFKYVNDKLKIIYSLYGNKKYSQAMHDIEMKEIIIKLKLHLDNKYY